MIIFGKTFIIPIFIPPPFFPLFIPMFFTVVFVVGGNKKWFCRGFQRRFGGRWLRGFFICDFKDDFHVVGQTHSAVPSMNIVLGRGGNEIIVFTGYKFDGVGSGAERPEWNGEKFVVVRLIALGDYVRILFHDATAIAFLLCSRGTKWIAPFGSRARTDGTWDIWCWLDRTPCRCSSRPWYCRYYRYESWNIKLILL